MNKLAALLLDPEQKLFQSRTGTGIKSLGFTTLLRKLSRSGLQAMSRTFLF
jgi:hypothetical protein